MWSINLFAHSLVQQLATALLSRRWVLATAESCTGGLIAAACTELAGSSAWFDRGFVTYSNEAKKQMLGVPSVTLAAHGAVSEPTAKAMCEGALFKSHAHLAVAVTGIAGPSGGSAAKPVGTVCFGFAQKDVNGTLQVETTTQRFMGDRAAVRAQALEFALQGLVLRASK